MLDMIHAELIRSTFSSARLQWPTDFGGTRGEAGSLAGLRRRVATEISENDRETQLDIGRRSKTLCAAAGVSRYRDDEPESALRLALIVAR